LPWVVSKDADKPFYSGLGAANFGIKWRFADQEDSGFSLSVYRQYTTPPLMSSASRRLAPSGRQLFLPWEGSTTIGSFGIDAKLGRNFIPGEVDGWHARIVGSHSCRPSGECLLELRETNSSLGGQTLVNAGLRWELGDAVTLLASCGREASQRTSSQQQLLLYLGVQLTH
jgi:hypothetical protein